MNIENSLHPSWKKYLKKEFKKEYFLNLKSFLKAEASNKKIIYPQTSEVFSAFNYSTFEKTKVVIIGQDPYHGEGQANGLSFSVKPGLKIPPSLRNIFKELENDLGIKPAKNGDLTKWAEQGVLLLNNVLTVEKSLAASHKNQGWEKFTDEIIKILNQEKEALVFILWGAPAHKKGAIIDEKKHLVLKSVHPSPLSAYRGFFNNHHFSKTNKFLKKQKKSIIDWSLNDS